MRIRTQLIASAALAAAVAVLVVAGLWVVTRQAQARLDEQAESQQVARDLANLLMLTNEFAVYGGERATSQWRARHAQLLATLERTARRHDPPSPPLVELRHEVDDLAPLLDKLVQVAQEPPTPLAARRRELLLERLLIETQNVIENRHRWALAIGVAQQEDQRRYSLMVLAAPAALFALLVSLCVLLGRRVLVPLARLQAAAAAMQGGDLAVRCSSSAPDELGDAARAVDAMALALQQQSAALQASEQHLRLVADNLPALVAHIDAGERYTFVNAHIGRFFGGDPRDMLGRTLHEVCGEAVYRDIELHVARALRGETVSFENQARVQDRLSHYQSTYVPDLDAAGQVRGFYAMTFDITARKEAELQVARSEQRLLDLMNNLPAVVGYFDMQERCQFANDTALRSQGLTREDLPGLTLRGVLGESNYAQHEPYVKEALKGRRSRLDGRIPFEGRPAHFHAHLIPDRVDGGVQRGFYVMTFDITALKEAELRQARVERQLRAITDNLPVLISYLDKEERYVFVNATLRDWLGLDPVAVIGQRVAEVVDPAHYEPRREFLRRALAGERVEFDIESAPRGVPRNVQNVYIPDIQSDGSVAGIYTLSTDVTALKQVERQLSRLARVDALTGLPNRRQLQERLMEAIARASRTQRPLAMMFLDVDHFKSINDRLGHGAGDAVLREFAARLKLAVRVTDTAARLAGDEFVVLLEGLHSAQEAEIVAAKVLAAIRRPFHIEGTPLAVSASLGVAYCERPGPHSPLMDCADQALYDAKEAGRDTFKIRCMEPAVGGGLPQALDEPVRGGEVSRMGTTP